MWSHYKYPVSGITLRINEHEQNSTIEMRVRDGEANCFASFTEEEAIALKQSLEFLIGRLKFRRGWWKKNKRYNKLHKQKESPN